MQDNKYITKDYLQTYFDAKGFTPDRAQKLVENLSNKGYTIQGYNDQQTQSAEQKSFQAIKEGISNIGNDIKTGYQETKAGIQDASKAMAEVQLPPSEVGKKIISLFSSPLGALGKAIGHAGETAYKVADSELGGGLTDIAKAGIGVAQDIAPNTTKEIVKQLNDAFTYFDTPQWQEYKKTSPEEARIAENLVSATNIVLAPTRGSIQGISGSVKGAVSDIAKTSKNAAQDIKPLAEKAKQSLTGLATPKTTTEAMDSFKNNLTEQLSGRKAQEKVLSKANTDIIDTLSKHPEYYPEIDAKNKAFNTQVGFNKVSEDINSIGQATNDMFSAADKIDGGVSLENLMNALKENLNTTKLKNINIAQGGKLMDKLDLKNIINTAKATYGDMIPRTAVWDIRKQIDNVISGISDTNALKTARQDVRKAFATSLGDSMGDFKTLVDDAMSEMQKRIEIRDFLDPAKTGNLASAKLQGGKLTDLVRNAAVSHITSTLTASAGGILLGVPGALAGYGISEGLGRYLAKNTLLKAADRKVLKDYLAQNPKILSDIEDFIKKADNYKSKTGYKPTPEEVKMIEKNLKTLNQTEPSMSSNTKKT